MKSKTWKVIVDFVLAFLLILFMVLFINSCIDSPGLKGNVCFKVATSMCFVLDGLLWMDWKSSKNKKIPLFLLVGFVCMLIGDYNIFYNFAIGAAACAVGHIMYLISFNMLRKFEKNDLILGLSLTLFTSVIIIAIPELVYEPHFMLYVCLGYGVIISFMTAKSINNYLKIRDTFTLVVCIGSVVFFLSDFMVLCNAFAKNQWIYTHIGHVMYFPAQFVLAQGIRKYFEKD